MRNIDFPEASPPSSSNAAQAHPPPFAACQCSHYQCVQEDHCGRNHSETQTIWALLLHEPKGQGGKKKNHLLAKPGRVVYCNHWIWPFHPKDEELICIGSNSSFQTSTSWIWRHSVLENLQQVLDICGFFFETRAFAFCWSEFPLTSHCLALFCWTESLNLPLLPTVTK